MPLTQGVSEQSDEGGVAVCAGSLLLASTWPGHAAPGRCWPTEGPPSQGAGDDAGSPGTRSLGSVMEPLSPEEILDARAGFIS